MSTITASSGGLRRPATTTRAPSAARRVAVSRPMPVPPPVTIATCPSSCPILACLLRPLDRQVAALQLLLATVEFRRRPREHDRALAQHDNLVAHGQRHARVLLHEQDRHALALEAEENALELTHEQGSQALRRLVEHEQIRVASERARDGEHLLLAAREASSGLARPLVQDGEVVVNSPERPARTSADDA